MWVVIIGQDKKQYSKLYVNPKLNMYACMCSCGADVCACSHGAEACMCSHGAEASTCLWGANECTCSHDMAPGKQGKEICVHGSRQYNRISKAKATHKLEFYSDKHLC